MCQFLIGNVKQSRNEDDNYVELWKVCQFLIGNVKLRNKMAKKAQETKVSIPHR